VILIFHNSAFLVWAGTELIIFTAAGKGLWFGFVLETVLTARGHFRYCRAALAQRRGLFCSSRRPRSDQAGGHMELEGDMAMTADPQLTEGIVHTM